MKFLVAAALAWIVGVLAGPIEPRGTAPTIIGNIKMVTDMSNDLRTIVDNIDILNVLFEGHKIPQGFQQIIQAVEITIGVLEQGSQSQNNTKSHYDRSTIPERGMSTDTYSPAEADAVVDVLTTFVVVHQVLLNVVIGKHGLLAQFFFAEPIRLVLVALEAIIDRFAFALIVMIPTRAPDAMLQVNNLGATLTVAIAVYS